MVTFTIVNFHTYQWILDIADFAKGWSNINLLYWTTENCLVWKWLLSELCFIHRYTNDDRQWTFFAHEIMPEMLLTWPQINIMFTLVATTSATPCRISFIPKRKCLILFQMCKTVLRNVLVFLVEVNGLQCFLQNIFSCVPKKKEFFRTTIDCSISVAQTSFFF